MKVACQRCGAEFKTVPARIADGRGKYCSRKCGGEAKSAARKPIDFGAALGVFNRNYIPEPNSGCWLWEGRIHSDGYGLLSVNGHKLYAHRLAMRLRDVRLTAKECACHRCDNPYCVNPDHLFVGTRGDNTRDMWRKGRSRVRPPLREKCALTKFSLDQLREIAAAQGRAKDVAAQFGVSASYVYALRKNSSLWGDGR